MTREIVAVAIALAVVISAYGLGMSHERGRWQDRAAGLQARYDTATALSVERARRLTEAEAERAALASKLEEQADADDDAGRVALPARSVQRIDAR